MVHLPSDDNILAAPVESNGSVRDVCLGLHWILTVAGVADVRAFLQAESELSKAQKKKQKKKAAAERKKTDGDSTQAEATPAGAACTFALPLASLPKGSARIRQEFKPRSS